VKKTRKHLELYRQIYALREKGITFEKIGRKVGLSRQRAQAIFKNCRKEDLIDRDNICSYCCKLIENGQEKVECEPDNFHRSCWRRAIFS
jgi:hypothetical protein